MATYTHNVTAVPSGIHWYDVTIDGNNPVTASSTTLILNNSDGTVTRIQGTGFTYDGSGNPTGGTVTSIDRANGAAGTTIYETVAGLNLSLVDLTNTGGVGNREAFALIFSGADTFTGFTGNDLFVGGPGADAFTGGTGTDTVSYDNATAAVSANLGNNANNTGDAVGDTYSSIENLIGSDFNDSLTGNGANNVITGGLGNDTLNGGNGTTTGNDTLDGGDGNGDLANYANNANATTGITATLSSTSQVVGNGADLAVFGTDTLISVEQVRGTSFNDTFTATGTFNASSGLFNEFEGMDGDDIITGNGQTRLSYRQADDGVAVDLLAGTAQSIAGGDAAGIGVDSFTGVNAVRGSDFNDTITAAGASGNFSFLGQRGNDTLTGTARNGDLARYDLISGAAGTINNGIIVTLDATSTVTDQAGGNAAGTDTLIGVENVRGTSAVDNFTATDAFIAGLGTPFNEFEGMGGNDIITGNGVTRVSYSQATNSVTVNLLAGTAQATGADAGIGVDSFAGTIGPNNINRVNAAEGSAFDDVITAAGARGQFDFVGGRGNDTLIGSAEAINNFDNNEARYDIGTNTPNAISVVLDTTSTVTDIGGSAFGTDTLINIERVRGTDLNDTFVANAGFSGPYGTQNSFEGMGGNDTITGNGHTFIRYGNADAAVTVNLQTGIAQSTAGGDAAGIGVDTIVGGVNEVFGSNFDDAITGSNGAGAESLSGSAGNDTIDGGGGLLDRVGYRNLNATTGVTVNLTTGIATDSFGGTDTLTNIEGVGGSEFNDLITGDGNVNRLGGQNGDDQLFGMGGDDFLVGDDGVDLYAGAFGSFTAFDSGNDLLDGGTGADQMWGGKGNDTYVVDNDGDVVTENASEGTDTVQTTLAIYSLGPNVENLTFTDNGTHTGFGNSLSNVMTGGDGNDTLVGSDNIFGSEVDTLIGGNGNDTLHAEANDIINGGAGTDFLFQVNANPWTIDLGATSIEWMFAGFGNDTINAATQTARVDVFASGGNDVVTGSNFDDNLWAGVGNDTLNGGDGNDLLFGDLGVDSLSGGAGNDNFYADSADTLISGGSGTDNLYWTENVGANIDMVADSLEWAQTLGGNDTVTGAAGSADLVVFAGAGNDTVTGGSGADFLWGEADNDIITGNGGNDVLVGGTGADRLTGGAGTDNLYGSSGGGADGAVDTYVFTSGWGTDFVYDFENGTDEFDMTALGIQFSDLTITDVGPHTHVSFGGNTFVVVNGAGQVNSADFLF